MKKTLLFFVLISMLLTLCACGSVTEKASSTVPETKAKEVKKLEGIDVSAYSGEIDWERVAADGIEFAMIRLGGRGYGEEGALYTDDFALDNIKQAQQNSISVGVYFYSQAISTEEAEQEAEYVGEILGNTKIELPVAYDFEHISDDVARTDEITSNEQTAFAEVFCGKINELGYDAMVYAYADDFENGFKTNYPIWLADYEKKSDVKYTMLQYSAEGNVDGIEGSVDLDLLIEEK